MTSVAALTGCVVAGQHRPTNPSTMVNLGGRSQRDVHIYLVWLGASGADRIMVSQVEAHLGELSGSRYVARLQQYGVRDIRYVESARHTMTSPEYAPLLTSILKRHPKWAHDPLAQVVLVLPPGAHNGREGAAAFHSRSLLMGREVIWSVIDYQDIGSSTAEAMQSLITHEVVEAATNVDGSGYANAKGDAIGDPCNWNITLTDTGGAVQQFWDNRTAACWPNLPDGSVFVMHRRDGPSSGVH